MFRNSRILLFTYTLTQLCLLYRYTHAVLTSSNDLRNHRRTSSCIDPCQRIRATRQLRTVIQGTSKWHIHSADLQHDGNIPECTGNGNLQVGGFSSSAARRRRDSPSDDESGGGLALTCELSLETGQRVEGRNVRCDERECPNIVR